MSSIPYPLCPKEGKHTLLSELSLLYLRDGPFFPARIDLPHALVEAERQVSKVADKVEDFIVKVKVVTNEIEYYEQLFRFYGTVQCFNALCWRIDFLAKQSEAEYPGYIKRHTLPADEFQDLKNKKDFLGTALRAKVRMYRFSCGPENHDPDTHGTGEADGLACYEEACDCLHCQVGDMPDKQVLTAQQAMALDDWAYEQMMRTSRETEE
ncbi:hypothetical protein F5X99DRAFT_414294 [Biscogniauxia marginata]|nr:hypothetical protein F5X99DRAFT_414294 [Biscogniauxia marginata]